MVPVSAAVAASAATMQRSLPSGVPFLMELPLVHYLASGYQGYRQYLLSHSSVASFLSAADAFLLRLLSFYNPTLPAAERVSAAWPLMRPADLVIVIMTYLSFVACVYIGHVLASRISTPLSRGQKLRAARQEQNEEKHSQTQKQSPLEGKKHPLLEKMGVTLVVQSIYNLLQVCVCSYVVYKTVVVFATEGYTLTFNKFDPSRTSMAEIVWLFYLTKVFDLVDTLLIVWRGKWNQFSFLHVYHHASIIYMMWVNASVAYDGDIYFAVLANAAIHVVMYTYYLMASLSFTIAPKMKRFVTQGQMTQFLCMLFQGIYHSFFYSSCEYPFRVAIGYMLYITSMYVLFAQFSKKTYGPSSKNGISSTDSEASTPGTSKSEVYRRLCKTLETTVTPHGTIPSHPSHKKNPTASGVATPYALAPGAAL